MQMSGAAHDCPMGLVSPNPRAPAPGPVVKGGQPGSLFYSSAEGRMDSTPGHAPKSRGRTGEGLAGPPPGQRAQHEVTLLQWVPGVQHSPPVGGPSRVQK